MVLERVGESIRVFSQKVEDRLFVSKEKVRALGLALIEKGIDLNILRSYSNDTLIKQYINMEFNLEDYSSFPQIRFQYVDVEGKRITPTSIRQVIELIKSSETLESKTVNQLLHSLLRNLELHSWVKDRNRRLYRFADSSERYGGTVIPGLSFSYPFIEKVHLKKELVLFGQLISQKLQAYMQLEKEKKEYCYLRLLET